MSRIGNLAGPHRSVINLDELFQGSSDAGQLLEDVCGNLIVHESNGNTQRFWKSMKKGACGSDAAASWSNTSKLENLAAARAETANCCENRVMLMADCGQSAQISTTSL